VLLPMRLPVVGGLVGVGRGLAILLRAQTK